MWVCWGWAMCKEGGGPCSQCVGKRPWTANTWLMAVNSLSLSNHVEHDNGHHVTMSAAAFNFFFPSNSVKSHSKTLLARKLRRQTAFSISKSLTLSSGFWLDDWNQFPKNLNYKEVWAICCRNKRSCIAHRQVWEVFSPHNRQSMLCPPSTSFTYPPIYLAHLLCWKLPLFDCLGGSCCATCKRWAIVGKGQRAGGTRATRNPEKGNKMHGDRVGRVGIKRSEWRNM